MGTPIVGFKPTTLVVKNFLGTYPILYSNALLNPLLIIGTSIMKNFLVTYTKQNSNAH